MIFTNCGIADAEKNIGRVTDGIEKLNRTNKKYKIALSYGFSDFHYTQKRYNIDKIIEIADKNMYKNKTKRKLA
jgi:hypothetical protein